MAESPVLLVTGARKGIGRHLAEHYLGKGFRVVGCSRKASDLSSPDYRHYELDVTDEESVVQMFSEIGASHGRLDHLLNNAGIASMNHFLLTPMETARRIYETNVLGTILFCREGAKLMHGQGSGRIVNFNTVAAPLKLEGEAVYASSKAAVISLTQILSREFANFSITVNAIGPTPVKTQLISGVPESKLQALLDRQAIKRYGEYSDITNVVDFFLQPESNFVTGQVLFLGGV